MELPAFWRENQPRGARGSFPRRLRSLDAVHGSCLHYGACYEKCVTGVRAEADWGGAGGACGGEQEPDSQVKLLLHLGGPAGYIVSWCLCVCVWFSWSFYLWWVVFSCVAVEDRSKKSSAVFHAEKDNIFCRADVQSSHSLDPQDQFHLFLIKVGGTVLQFSKRMPLLWITARLTAVILVLSFWTAQANPDGDFFVLCKLRF